MNPIILDANAMRVRSKTYKKYGAALFRSGPRKPSAATAEDINDKPPRICVEGLAVEFDTPILDKHGDTIIFEPTAFDKYFESGARPEFWLGHDSTKVIGSGVELCLLNEGVAFRFEVPKEQVATVRKMVESGERAAISIGFKRTKTRDDVCFGHPVTFIEVAEMVEVSGVPVGASTRAFARIVDANREPRLHQSVNSAMFGIEYDWHNIKNIRRENDAALQRVADKLSMLECCEEPAFEQRSSMTADESNRFHTAWYDRMQEDRRAEILG